MPAAFALRRRQCLALHVAFVRRDYIRFGHFVSLSFLTRTLFFFSDFRFFDRPKSFRFQSKLVLVALYILHWLTFHSTVWSFGHQFLLFSSFIRRLFRVLSPFDGPKIISLHFHNSSEQLSELYELNSFWKKSTTFDRKKIRYFYFQFHVAQTNEIAMKMKMKSLFLSMANMIDFHTCY